MFSLRFSGSVLAAVLLGLVAISAGANTVPPRGLVDSRVRTIAYNASDVVRLQGFVGYQIDLEFAPGEEFVNLAAGDTAGLSVGAVGNHLMIKPKKPKVMTNLTVITNQHVYQFDYSAKTRAPEARDEVIYSLKFMYPDAMRAQAVAAANTVKAEEALAEAASARSHNTNYWFCGPRALRPSTAFDDGIQTHLTFAPNAELPAIFVRAEDGAETLVNYTVEGDDVVVHRIAPALVLRRGAQVGCVQNRGFLGSGVSLPTGTVAPSVQRTARGGAP